MQTDSNRPEASNAFEMERWMPWILPQQLIALVGEPANVTRQCTIMLPEPRVGMVPHRSVQRPARKSSSASSASASRRPLTISNSMRRSHASASNSANHARNAASSAAERPCTASSISFMLPTSSSLTTYARPEQDVEACRKTATHMQQTRRPWSSANWPVDARQSAGPQVAQHQNLLHSPLSRTETVTSMPRNEEAAPA
jgi:hypothetical protein